MDTMYRYRQVKWVFSVLGWALERCGPPGLIEDILSVLENHNQDWLHAAATAINDSAFKEANEHAGIVRAAARALAKYEKRK